MNLEVEAKFQIDDLATIKDRLLALGGTVTKGRLYEKNTVYDDEAQSLKNGQKLSILLSICPASVYRIYKEIIFEQ